MDDSPIFANLNYQKRYEVQLSLKNIVNKGFRGGFFCQHCLAVKYQERKNSKTKYRKSLKRFCLCLRE